MVWGIVPSIFSLPIPLRHHSLYGFFRKPILHGNLAVRLHHHDPLMTERDVADRKCRDLLGRAEYRSSLLCPGCRKMAMRGTWRTGLLFEIEVQKRTG
jgi:hypothetical protein